MSGYQQAILLLLGQNTGGKYLVRCADRWYIDCVSSLFPTAPYLQRRADGKRDFWTLKSARVSYHIDLSDVRDITAFCRGVVELQGSLDLWRHRTRSGAYIRTPRLRIWGAEELLAFVGAALPAAAKKLQHIATNTGETCALYYQSPSEVADIIAWLHGDPCNCDIWARYGEVLNCKENKK